MQSTVARLASLVFCLFPAGLGAQTFVVDPTPGAGQFTDLQSAVNAVPDGSAIRVHAGAYPTATTTISGKGLTIPGDAGLTLQGELVVQSTTASQSVVVAGLRYNAHPFVIGGYFNNVFRVIGCAGPVLLDNCEFTSGSTGSSSRPGGLTVLSSSQVMVRECRASSGSPSFMRSA